MFGSRDPRDRTPRAFLVLSGALPGLRGLDRWVRRSHRLKEGKEMPLRLRLIEFGADVVAGGRSSSGGEAGSRCLGGAEFGAVGRPPWLEGHISSEARISAFLFR